MPLARRTLMLVSFVTGLAGCSSTTQPVAPHATVTVRASSLPAVTTTVGAYTSIQFTVPVRIENSGTTTLAYPHCTARIDAHTADTWTAAWTPICPPTTSFGPLQIPPGESREFTETVQAIVSGPGAPAWYAAPGASEYRFVAKLEAPGTSDQIPEMASNSFTLVIGS